jgi:general stress protein 26
MKPPFDLAFLRSKIQDLRSALFFSQGVSVLKFPTSIITALKVDEEGQIWFFVPKPTQQLDSFDDEFISRLDFFRKGKHAFVQVTGKATVVQNPALINEFLQNETQQRVSDCLALVKVKILNADYFEATERVQNDLLLGVRNMLYATGFSIRNSLQQFFSMKPAWKNASAFSLKRVFQHLFFTTQTEQK